MNQVILSGRLVKDCEVRRTASNIAIVIFTLAVDEYNPKTKQRESQFFDCKVFGIRGETFAKYMQKGDATFVMGHLHKDTFTTKDGRKTSKIEVIVEDFEFGAKKKGAKEENPTNAILDLEDARPQEEPPVQPLEDLTDEDLPF